MLRYITVFIALFLTGCTTDNHTQDIQKLLKERNISISQQDITQYTSLLEQQYLAREGEQKVEQMATVFTRFEKVQMDSRDQEIRIIDDQHAICEQTYILKVFADGDWRKIVQREQLTFSRTDGVWKISGGL